MESTLWIYPVQPRTLVTVKETLAFSVDFEARCAESCEV